MFTVSVELVVPVPRVPPSLSLPLTVSPLLTTSAQGGRANVFLQQTLSRLVTWSLSLLRLSSRLTPVSPRWFATAVVAAVAVAAMVAGVAVVVVVAAAATTLLPMPLPLEATAVGKTARNAQFSH